MEKYYFAGCGPFKNVCSGSPTKMRVRESASANYRQHNLMSNFATLCCKTNIKWVSRL